MSPDTDSYRLWSNPGHVCLLVLAIAAIFLAVFRIWPQIDQQLSAFFVDPAACDNIPKHRRCHPFPLVTDEFWRNIRKVGFLLPLWAMIASLIYLVWLMIKKPGTTRRRVGVGVVAAVSAFLGPIVISNLILKEFWGRPRPYQTDLFSGESPFVLPGTIASYCDSNCSFVSGEATAATWMIVLILFIPRSKRGYAAVVLTLFAIFVSVLRVAFGRHYTSDVVIGSMIALLCVTFLAWAIQTAPVSRWLDKIFGFSIHTEDESGHSFSKK